MTHLTARIQQEIAPAGGLPESAIDPGIAVVEQEIAPVTGLLVEYAIDFGIVVLLAGMGLCVARLIRGPHLADRALAADTLLTHLMALVILFTIRARSLLLFDGVMVLALLGFVTSVAFAQYIIRPHLRRPPHPEGSEPT